MWWRMRHANDRKKTALWHKLFSPAVTAFIIELPIIYMDIFVEVQIHFGIGSWQETISFKILGKVDPDETTVVSD